MLSSLGTSRRSDPLQEKRMLTKATFKILSWDEEPFDEPDDPDQSSPAPTSASPSTATCPAPATSCT